MSLIPPHYCVTIRRRVRNRARVKYFGPYEEFDEAALIKAKAFARRASKLKDAGAIVIQAENPYGDDAYALHTFVDGREKR